MNIEIESVEIDPDTGFTVWEFGLASHTNPAYCLTPSEDILKMEEDAWDVAEMIFRIRSARRIALQTYRQDIDRFDPDGIK